MSESGPSIASEVIYKLKHGDITYTNSEGDATEGKFITLFPPKAGNKHYKLVASLKEMFIISLNEARQRAMVAMAKSDQEEPEMEEPNDDDDSDALPFTSDEIIGTIASCERVGLYDFIEEGKSLLVKKGFAKVGGETQLNNGHFDFLMDDDVENLVGEYVANFILGSFR